MHKKSGQYGVIDIGSNSVRMMIFDLTQTPAYYTFNEKVFCALGRDLETTGKLNKIGVEIALETLIQYASILKQEQVDAVSVIGTAALREAQDGSDFVERVYTQTGLKIRIISGAEEARYAALGVLSLTPEAQGIIADFGGGSLELAILAAGKILDTASYPLGAFRLLHAGDQAASRVQKYLAQLPELFKDQKTLYTIGGSWRAMALAHMRSKGEADQPVQGYQFHRSELLDFTQKIKAMTPPEIEAAWSIDPKRAQLLPIAALALTEIVKFLPIENIVISAAGVRDGVVIEYLSSQNLAGDVK